MQKFILSIFITTFFFVTFTKSVSADIVNPNYFQNKCLSGEQEVECNYKSNKPFGPKTYDECAKYDNNTNYKFLVEQRHSFGGSKKFCSKEMSTLDLVLYHIKTLAPLLLITIAIECPIFLLFGFKDRRSLTIFVSANFISIPLLYLSTVFIPFTWPTVLFLEILVIFFEAYFLKIFLKQISFRKILIYSFIANAISATMGSVLLKILSNILIK